MIIIDCVCGRHQDFTLGEVCTEAVLEVLCACGRLLARRRADATGLRTETAEARCQNRNCRHVEADHVEETLGYSCLGSDNCPCARWSPGPGDL